MPQELRKDDFVRQLLAYSCESTAKTQEEIKYMLDKFIGIKEFRAFILDFEGRNDSPETFLSSLHIVFTMAFLVALKMRPYEIGQKDIIQ